MRTLIYTILFLAFSHWFGKLANKFLYRKVLTNPQHSLALLKFHLRNKKKW